jgi:hypothetical protein
MSKMKEAKKIANSHDHQDVCGSRIEHNFGLARHQSLLGYIKKKFFYKTHGTESGFKENIPTK